MSTEIETAKIRQQMLEMFGEILPRQPMRSDAYEVQYLMLQLVLWYENIYVGCWNSRVAVVLTSVCSKPFFFFDQPDS